MGRRMVPASKRMKEPARTGTCSPSTSQWPSPANTNATSSWPVDASSCARPPAPGGSSERRMALGRRPRGEFGAVRADCWDEDSGALVDPAGLWYWEDRTPPDLALVDAQHAALVAALEAEGVEVVEVEGDLPAHITTPIYT